MMSAIKRIECRRLTTFRITAQIIGQYADRPLLIDFVSRFHTEHIG